MLDSKMQFRCASSNIQEARFSNGVLVFKMQLYSVSVVQWQSLVWLLKLGRVLFAGCESALPSAPWHTIHPSLSRPIYRNKVEQNAETPLPISRNHKLFLGRPSPPRLLCAPASAKSTLCSTTRQSPALQPPCRIREEFKHRRTAR